MTLDDDRPALKTGDKLYVVDNGRFRVAEFVRYVPENKLRMLIRIDGGSLQETPVQRRYSWFPFETAEDAWNNYIEQLQQGLQHNDMMLRAQLYMRAWCRAELARAQHRRHTVMVPLTTLLVRDVQVKALTVDEALAIARILFINESDIKTALNIHT